MTDRELMQQALEALEFHSCGDEIDETICASLRERLAQPVQEPIACKHGWIRTGAMAEHERRCIYCGAWNDTKTPEQEPVAWGIANTRPTESKPLMMVMLDEPPPSHLVIPLYTAPTPQRRPQTTHWDGCEAVHPECRKPEQEPVAWMDRHGACMSAVFKEIDATGDEYTTPLYTTPPQREWVGLTHSDIVQGLQDTTGYLDRSSVRDQLIFARAIEAKLKEKNSG